MLSSTTGSGATGSGATGSWGGGGLWLFFFLLRLRFGWEVCLGGVVGRRRAGRSSRCRNVLLRLGGGDCFFSLLLAFFDGRLRGFRAEQVGDREHPDEDHPKGHEERREVAVAGHRAGGGARGSARRRLSHAFAGLTRVALLLAISGAGERTQPSASEHHYESLGDSVVLRDSCFTAGEGR